MRIPAHYIVLLLATAQLTTSAILAIDYGLDSYKAVLIKSGSNIDIVLNRDSKRKTSSVLTLRDSERSYGADAINLV